MARPPRSMAVNPASAPDILPIGVRAPEMITDPDTTSIVMTGAQLGSARNESHESLHVVVAEADGESEDTAGGAVLRAMRSQA